MRPWGALERPPGGMGGQNQSQVASGGPGNPAVAEGKGGGLIWAYLYFGSRCSGYGLALGVAAKTQASDWMLLCRCCWGFQATQRGASK
jgi:hypothetical protein